MTLISTSRDARMPLLPLLWPLPCALSRQQTTPTYITDNPSRNKHRSQMAVCYTEPARRSAIIERRWRTERTTSTRCGGSRRQWTTWSPSTRRAGASWPTAVDTARCVGGGDAASSPRTGWRRRCPRRCPRRGSSRTPPFAAGNTAGRPPRCRRFRFCGRRTREYCSPRCLWVFFAAAERETAMVAGRPKGAPPPSDGEQRPQLRLQEQRRHHASSAISFNRRFRGVDSVPFRFHPPLATPSPRGTRRRGCETTCDTRRGTSRRPNGRDTCDPQRHRRCNASRIGNSTAPIVQSLCVHTAAGSWRRRAFGDGRGPLRPPAPWDAWWTGTRPVGSGPRPSSIAFPASGGFPWRRAGCVRTSTRPSRRTSRVSSTNPVAVRPWVGRRLAARRAIIVAWWMLRATLWMLRCIITTRPSW